MAKYFLFRSKVIKTDFLGPPNAAGLSERQSHFWSNLLLCTNFIFFSLYFKNYVLKEPVNNKQDHVKVLVLLHACKEVSFEWWPSQLRIWSTYSKGPKPPYMKDQTVPQESTTQ